jgi:tetratricopeptide (TPR) repeat protein
MNFDLLGLLRAKRYEKLDAELSAIQQSYEQGANEWAVLQTYLLFETSDETLASNFDAWVAREEQSWPARLARGIYHVNLGWEARGTKFSNNTPREQFDKMNEHFARAKEDISIALTQKPKALVGYSMLLQIARGNGEEPEKQRLIREIDRYIPTSYYIRWQHMVGLEPKWGGSWAQMREFARESQKWRDKNPRVYALLGYERSIKGWYAKREKDYESAADHYTQALAYAPVSNWLSNRAYVYRKLKRYDNAIADLDTLLSKDPDNARALTNRGYAYMKLKQLDSARADFARALRIDPQRRKASNNLGWMHWKRREYNEAAEYFDHTLKYHPDNYYALSYCGHTNARLRRLEKAKACYQRAAEERPEDPDAWRNYGDVLFDLKDPKHFEVLARYIQLADPDKDPVMYNKIKDYLAEHYDKLPKSSTE